MSRRLVCDFCGHPDHGPDATFVIPAATFAYDVTDKLGRAHFSDEDWLACETCAVLVRDGRRVELVDRAVAAYDRHSGPLSRIARQAVRQLMDNAYQKLWANRQGEPVPLTPEMRAAIVTQWPEPIEVRKL